MSKKSDYKQEKNPLLVVLYIAAVLLLLGCIVFFVFSSKERQKAYEDQIRQAAENETEYIMTERLREIESESEAAREKTKASDAGADTSSNGAVDPESEKKADVSGAGAEKESGQALPEDSESETGKSEPEIESDTEEASTEHIFISSAEKAQTVLVLNGTKKPGVAGNWKDRLEGLGYRKVVSASYDGEIEDNTVFYTGTGAKTEGLEQIFPDCVIRQGKVYTGIEPGEGETLPEQVDVYVVVGRNDALEDNSGESE